MIRLILVLLLFFKLDIAVAQKNLKLEGKWKIISVSQVISNSRDSLYYDLEKDSIYIPAEDLKEAAKDGHDSVFTVNLFKNMFESFKGSSINFKKDSVSFKTKSALAKGTFQINGTDVIEMHLKNEANEKITRTYSYFFKGDLLHISMKTDMGYSKYILRKE